MLDYVIATVCTYCTATLIHGHCSMHACKQLRNLVLITCTGGNACILNGEILWDCPEYLSNLASSILAFVGLSSKRCESTQQRS
jgi:hypothetical protein